MEPRWSDFVQAVTGKDIICYGAGTNGLIMLANERFHPFLEQVKCFVDKDPRKHGKKLTCKAASYDIFPLEYINQKNDCVVLVTLSDYVTVGRFLSEKGIEWFPWTVISTEAIFESLSIKREDDRPAVFLLNTPDYMNLGDQAIAAAENKYLLSNFGNYYEFGTHACHPGALTKLQSYVKPGDIMLFQGGGNIGSLWRVCEEIFRDVLQKFPDNPVIVFPQSVFYGDTKEEQEYFNDSRRIYNAHKELLICTRDRRSYDFVRQSYNCKCMLLPDMVLTLKPDFVSERKGIGVLLRNDKEQRLPDEYNKVVNNVIEQLEEQAVPITHHPVDTVLNREDRVNRVLKEYSSCKLIITDRLHGMIFAAITNTPCIAFDNSYHKVSDLYETWLKECRHISVSEALSEEALLELAKTKLCQEESLLNHDFFERQLQPLTDYINLLMKRGTSFYV